MASENAFKNVGFTYKSQILKFINLNVQRCKEIIYKCSISKKTHSEIDNKFQIENVKIYLLLYGKKLYYLKNGEGYCSLRNSYSF